MKQFKKMIFGMFILLSTGLYANMVNMSPIITYLLSDSVAATPQEIAIEKIKEYADDQENPVPTVQDYINAGVTGVTEVNIDDVNALVASHMASEVDTLEAIQAVVDIVLDNSISFESDVMPIFVGNCMSCHDTDHQSNFKIGDTAAYTHDNIITYNLINTISPDSSLILIKGNGGHNKNSTDRLSDIESTIIRDWIEQGGLNN